MNRDVSQLQRIEADLTAEERERKLVKPRELYFFCVTRLITPRLDALEDRKLTRFNDLRSGLVVAAKGEGRRR